MKMRQSPSRHASNLGDDCHGSGPLDPKELPGKRAKIAPTRGCILSHRHVGTIWSFGDSAGTAGAGGLFQFDRRIPSSRANRVHLGTRSYVLSVKLTEGTLAGSDSRAKAMARA